MYLYLADAFLSGLEKPDSYLLSCLFVNSCLDLTNLDLSSNSMHMHYTLISWRNQLLLLWQLEDSHISLELGRLLTIVQVIADHIASADIVVIDIFYPHFDVVTCAGKRHPFVFSVIDLADNHLQPLRQYGHSLIFDDRPWFYLSIDIKVSNVSELINDGYTQRSHGFAFGERDIVKIFQETRPIIPWFCDSGMNVGVLNWFNRDESDIMEPTRVFQEGEYLFLNVIKSFLIPFYSTHLGYDCNELNNT